MSAAVRQALADAAGSCGGITCSTHFRQVTTPGAGMVRLDRIDYPNRLGGLATWHVLINLPQDIAAAERWLDEHTDELCEALSSEMSVRSITPRELALADGTRLPVVVIEGQRESE